MEKYIVKLTNDERENLISLINNGKASAKKLTHARILLAVDENANERTTDVAVAKSLHISDKTVHRVRQECVEHGIESALGRKPHSATRPLKIQGEHKAHLIAICCSTPPEGRCRWTMKLLANKLISLEIVDSVSPQTVLNTLNKNELKPWQKREWCIPEASSEFVCKMAQS